MLSLLKDTFHNKSINENEFFNELSKKINELKEKSILEHKLELKFYCCNVFYDKKSLSNNDVLELCGYDKNGISIIVHLTIEEPYYTIIIPSWPYNPLHLIELQNLLGLDYKVEETMLSPSYMYFPDKYFHGAKIYASNIKKLNMSISKVENWLIKTWHNAPLSPQRLFFEKCFADENSDLPYASFLFWKKSLLLNNYANTYQVRNNKQSYIGWIKVSNVKYSTDSTKNFKTALVYNASYKNISYIEENETPIEVPIGCYDIETFGSVKDPRLITSNISFGRIFDYFPIFNVVFSIKNFYFDLQSRTEAGPFVVQHNASDVVKDSLNIIIDDTSAEIFRKDYKNILLSDKNFLNSIYSKTYNEAITMIQKKNSTWCLQYFPEYKNIIDHKQWNKLRTTILENKLKHMEKWDEKIDLEAMMDVYMKIHYNNLNEARLILAYYRLIGLINPILIYQYNGYKFDNWVMLNRMKNLGIIKQAMDEYAISVPESKIQPPKFTKKQVKAGGKLEKANYILSYPYRVDVDIMNYVQQEPFLSPKYRDNGGFSLKNVCTVDKLKDENGEIVGKYDLPYIEMWRRLSIGDLHEINHYCIIDCRCTFIWAQSLNYTLFKMKYATINCVSFTDSCMKADSMKVEQLIYKTCIAINREPYDSRLIYTPYEEQEDVTIDKNEQELLNEDFIISLPFKKEIPITVPKLDPEGFEFEPYTKILKKDIKSSRYDKQIFGKIVGGHVECLKPGLSQGIIALDYSGQYPTQYLSKNIWCDSKIPNSIIENPDGLFKIIDKMNIKDCYGIRNSLLIQWENELLEVESFKTETDRGIHTTWYVVRKNDSLWKSGMAIKMLELRELRTHYRNLLAKATSNSTKAVYDAQQNAVKVLMNSTYGATAMNMFSFFDPYVAGTVTWCSRTLLMYARECFVDYKKLSVDSENYEKSDYIRHPVDETSLCKSLIDFRKKEDSYVSKLHPENKGIMFDLYNELITDVIYSDTDSNYFSFKLNNKAIEWILEVWKILDEKYRYNKNIAIFMRVMKLIIINSFSRYLTEAVLKKIHIIYQMPYIGLGVDASLYNGFWLGCKKKYCGIKLDIISEKLCKEYLQELISKMIYLEENLTIKDIKITGLQLKRRDSQPYIKKYMFMFLKQLLINDKKFSEIENIPHDISFMNELLEKIVNKFSIDFHQTNSILWDFDSKGMNIGLKKNFRDFLLKFYEAMNDYKITFNFDPSKQNAAKPLGIMLGLPESYKLDVIYVDYKYPDIKDVFTKDKYQVSVLDTDIIDDSTKENWSKIKYITTTIEEKLKLKGKKVDYSIPVCLFKYFIESLSDSDYRYMRLYSLYYKDRLIKALNSLIKEDIKEKKKITLELPTCYSPTQQVSYKKLQNLLVNKNGGAYNQGRLIKNAVKWLRNDIIHSQNLLLDNMEKKEYIYLLSCDELKLLLDYSIKKNILPHNNCEIQQALNELINKLQQ